MGKDRDGRNEEGWGEGWTTWEHDGGQGKWENNKWKWGDEGWNKGGVKHGTEANKMTRETKLSQNASDIIRIGRTLKKQRNKS